MTTRTPTRGEIIPVDENLPVKCEHSSMYYAMRGVKSVTKKSLAVYFTPADKLQAFSNDFKFFLFIGASLLEAYLPCTIYFIIANGSNSLALLMAAPILLLYPVVFALILGVLVKGMGGAFIHDFFNNDVSTPVPTLGNLLTLLPNPLRVISDWYAKLVELGKHDETGNDSGRSED
jgi:hypothetical protein